MSRISLEELESYLWSSAVLLRTHIDAGAYKQYIFPLLFFKRICLQKCSALSLNLKICSIFSAFNSAHNAFAEQMQQCYTALGIAHQSSEI